MNSFLAMIGLALGVFLLALAPATIPIALPSAPMWEVAATPVAGIAPAGPLLEGGSVRLRTATSKDAAWIDHVLSSWGSPLAGHGKDFLEGQQLYQINALIALAFCYHESGCMTAPNWAGWKGSGAHTWDLGNIVCAGTSPYWSGACYGRFRDYSDQPDPARAGILDWFHLINSEYIAGRGHQTVAQVVPVYAPSFENDVGGYTNVVDSMVAAWETEAAAAPAQASDVQQGLLDGDVGTNVLAALNANGGAIRRFTIAPGQIWSLGHAIAPISAMGYLPTVGGYPGGGWCDLAAMYVAVADQLGLDSQFPPHAGDYGPRFPGILLNEDGSGGDLTITNTSDRPVAFQVREEGGSLIVSGGFV